jgi:hypothetical protein
MEMRFCFSPLMPNLHEPKPMDRARLPFGRLLAVDLRSLSEDQMSVLTREAMKRGTSMPELLGQLSLLRNLQILLLYQNSKYL